MPHCPEGRICFQLASAFGCGPLRSPSPRSGVASVTARSAGSCPVRFAPASRSWLTVAAGHGRATARRARLHTADPDGHRASGSLRPSASSLTWSRSEGLAPASPTLPCEADCFQLASAFGCDPLRSPSPRSGVASVTARSAGSCPVRFAPASRSWLTVAAGHGPSSPPRTTAPGGHRASGSLRPSASSLTWSSSFRLAPASRFWRAAASRFWRAAASRLARALAVLVVCRSSL